MKSLKFFGVTAIVFLIAIESIAQNIIIDKYYQGNRTLRTGTRSNRNSNGANNTTGVKIYEFNDMTSWDTKFYDGKTFTDGAMTNGSNILTSAANFAVADIGKMINVTGAGVSGKSLVTTIASIISATQVTLAVNASTTVSAKTIRYGAKPAYTEGFYTTYGNGNFEMNYRLLFPVGYNPVENYKYPLIVMMHGAGERGNCWGTSCYGNAGDTLSTNPNYRNNDMNLTHGGQPHLNAVYLANGKKAEDPTLPSTSFPGFVLFPQNESGWNGPTQYEQAWRIIDLLAGTGDYNGDYSSAYNIDPDRIYLHGLSNGAAACWEVLRARPDLFAAILPMSATISHAAEIFTAIPSPLPAPPVNYNNYRLYRAATIPAWIFQGGVDTSPTPNNTNQEVAKLKAGGATPLYTIYPTTGHGTWGQAYAEPKFFSWMLQHNKKDIQILFSDSTLCATDNSGVKLALSPLFKAYQWEQDGAIIATSLRDSSYTVTQPGTYRARFSRISATPSEAQWNGWSKPVVIRETPAITPAITAVGTSHLPDILTGAISVRINGPTTKDLTKNWYINGTLNTTNTNFPPSNLDTANYTVRTSAGIVTLKTIPLNACSSLASNSIYVTLSTPSTLTAPATASAMVTAPGTVQLFWTDNTPDETGFEVYRSTTGSNGSFNFFKLLPEGTISYTDTGLTPSTTYYYQLRAVNITSVSPYTANIPVTTSADTQAPTAPQNLTFGNSTLSTIALSWTASTDNTGIGSYTIYNNGTTVIASNITTTSYTATGLTGNSNYLFTVKAIDLAGNVSQPSNQLLATTTFSGLNYSYSAVNVNLLTDAGNNWNTPELTGISNTGFDISYRKQDTYFNFNFNGYIFITTPGTYKFRTTSDDGSMLYLQGPFSTSNFVTNRIVNNDGLHGNTTVTSSNITLPANTAQQITALYFQQTGGQSLTVEYAGPDTGGITKWITIPNSKLNSGPAPTLTPPAAPTGLNAVSAGMSSINLSWNTVAAVSSYEVSRSIGSTNSFSVIANVTAPTTVFVDTGLLPSTSYTYKLKSVSNTNGSSGYSLTSSATTNPDTQAPTVPTGVTIISNNYINAGITWTASTDNVSVTSYKIFANAVLLGTSATNTFYTTTLLPGTFYNITVSALDVSGNESAQSAAASLTTASPVAFYSKPSSDLSLLNSWSSTTDGTGASPTSFTYNGQYFTIQNLQTLSSSLNIGGNVSRVIVADNVTVTIAQPLNGTIRAGSGSIVNINNVTYQPVFETLDPNSTVNFNTYSTIPVAKYGNLNLNDTGLKTVAAGTLEVVGSLTLANGVGIKGASSNGTIVKITKDLVTATTVATASSDNRVTLQFAGGTSHAITVSSDQLYYKIITSSADVVTFNTSGKTLSLGSLNGGGLDLANGSSLIVGNNTLALTDKAAVNPTTNTGEISINNGTIQLTTTATTSANFYFDNTNNKVQNFTLQSTAGGITNIKKAVEIYAGLKINNGVLNAGGFVRLKSSATASASIPQIVSGSIVGNVEVERYMAPNRVYRYLSSPVVGATVAQWQNSLLPITGNFTGTSVGPGLTTTPSMFYYDDSLLPNAWIAYPTTDNQATLLPGRGYATFVRDGASATTLLSTGVPNQGTIIFSLKGGTVASNNGWNLLGNPYASDVVWGTTGWASSNLSNVISIRQNNSDGSFSWLTWDKTTGNLPGGIIPAGQSFWVEATNSSPSLTISENAKTVQSGTTLFRSEADNNFNIFSIKLTNGSREDYAFVKLMNDGNDQYDKLKDGEKRDNSFFNLSTVSSDGVSLVINDLQNSFCEKIIPINLTNAAAGNYTLQFNDIANFSLANIQLVDAFLNTTIAINTNNNQFPIAITSDLASYKNRFSLKLTRPTPTTGNLVSSEKDSYCITEQNAIVTIATSQPGVIYEAIGVANGILSDKVVGNGDNIQLLIPVKNLLLNQNSIRIQSSFAGCSISTILANTKTITVSDVPTITVTSEISGCIGSALDIVASGSGQTYQWINEASSQPILGTGNTASIYLVSPITSYSVAALSDKGCKSEVKHILVKGESLDIPIITVSNGILETSSTSQFQWLLEGNLIEGANSTQYKPTQSGHYSVRATSTYCTKESSPIEYLVTGIEDTTNGSFAISVYPNPSETGEITITGTSSSTSHLQLQITDMLGKELITQPISVEEYKKGVAIDTNLPKGLYIVRVAQNKQSVHQKVVIR